MSTETARTALETADDVALAERMNESQQKVITEIGKVIIGQEDVVEQVLITLFVGGNSMITGVPGLAKTLLIWTMAEVMDLDFKRIQFTPDLMPSDITGTEIIQEDADTGRRKLVFMRGPVFAHVLLADEINRTPPKTQAALLESMQERQVTVGGERHPLPEPFFVLATQNPIEQEGTYPLPEAQQDRFMFFVDVDYPELDEEIEVMLRTTGNRSAQLATALGAEDIVEIQRIVREIPVADHLVEFAVKLARASRTRRGSEGDDVVPDFIRKYQEWGAGPRAGQYLLLGAKARTVLAGKTHVARADIVAVAQPVLRHRIIVNFAAEAEGIRSDDIVRMLLDHVGRGG